MIRTGQQYRDSIRDDRQVWVNGERVKDVTVHLMFRPLVDVRARIYDMQHDPRFAHALSYCSEADEVCAVALKLPHTQADWRAKREAVEAVLNEIGGVVTRVGDETVGEMWSLFDGQDILDEVDPAFSENIRRHVDRVVRFAGYGDALHYLRGGVSMKAGEQRGSWATLYLTNPTWVCQI